MRPGSWNTFSCIKCSRLYTQAMVQSRGGGLLFSNSQDEEWTELLDTVTACKAILHFYISMCPSSFVSCPASVIGIRKIYRKRGECLHVSISTMRFLACLQLEERAPLLSLMYVSLADHHFLLQKSMKCTIWDLKCIISYRDRTFCKVGSFLGGY